MNRITSNYLVFFAIGDAFNNQCIYSILSYLNIYNGYSPQSVTVVVYTDKEDKFTFLKSLLPIHIIHVSRDTIDTWLNGTSLFLRAKIEVVSHFLKNFSGKMLFVDTDVVFLKQVEALFDAITDETAILYVKEGNISSRSWNYYLRYWNKKHFALHSGVTISISKDSPMWNTGVIGLTSANAQLATNVLELCDKLTDIQSIGLNEQFAFSLVLSKQTKIKPSNSFIYHYWPFDYKSKMNEYISELLEDIEGKSIHHIFKSINENKILRISVKQKVLYYTSSKNIKMLIKRRLPLLYKVALEAKLF